jgi:hypothetical protein
MMNVHNLSIGDVRKARRNWNDDDYPEKIKELKRPTTTKYKLLRAYYRIHPFTSINAKINELVQKDELQDEIVDDLDQMEELVEEFQNDLQDWRDIRGETN